MRVFTFAFHQWLGQVGRAVLQAPNCQRNENAPPLFNNE